MSGTCLALMMAFDLALAAAPEPGVAGEGEPGSSAQSSPVETRAPLQQLRTWSLTVHPFELVPGENNGTRSFRMAVMAERKLAESISAAVELGLSPQTRVAESFVVGSVSAEARWYLFGSFEHGLNLAAKLSFLDSSGAGRSDQALAADVLFGWKLALASGFTLDFQGGSGAFIAQSRSDAFLRHSNIFMRVGFGWSI